MIGAVVYHCRAADAPHKFIPALFTAITALALIGLSTHQNPSTIGIRRLPRQERGFQITVGPLHHALDSGYSGSRAGASWIRVARVSVDPTCMGNASPDMGDADCILGDHCRGAADHRRPGRHRRTSLHAVTDPIDPRTAICPRFNENPNEDDSQPIWGTAGQYTRRAPDSMRTDTNTQILPI